MSTMIARTLTLVSVLVVQVFSEWPTDNEPMGLMGCRWFRYRGYWETMSDSLDEEENIEAVCLTVAAASVINYHRWPSASYFDALYSRCAEQGSDVPVGHRWDFRLINGTGGRSAACESDDPVNRVSATRSGWTGIDEIRKLMYVVERAYGFDHECFRSRTNECEGLGDYPLHHLMRNRFGYPLASSLSIKNAQARKTAIRSIRAGYPVIAMKCEHVFVLDGFKVHPSTGKGVFHAADYVNADETTGWFTWRDMVDDGLVRVIANLTPEVLLRKKPGQRKIVYWWGDDYIPQSSGTTRKGFIRLLSGTSRPLGNIEVVVTVQQRDSLVEPQLRTLAVRRVEHAGNVLRIPAQGTFSFDISSRALVSVEIRNREDADKRFRIMFHDFAGDHDLDPYDERKLLGAR